MTTGTPDRPAMKPRKGVMLGLLAIYVVWVGVMIAWSVALHHRK